MGESPSSSRQETGDAHLVVYLSGVTSEEIDALSEGFAEVIAQQGLGCTGGDDDPVRALIGVRAEEFPDLGDDDARQAFLDAHSMFVIPNAPEVAS